MQERSIGASSFHLSFSLSLFSFFSGKKNAERKEQTTMAPNSTQSKKHGPGGAARTAADAPDACGLSKASRFLGVYWNKKTGKWQARLCIPGRKDSFLGFHASEEDAARARDAEVRRRNLSPALLHFPAEGEAPATEVAGLVSSAAAAAAAQQQRQQQRPRKRQRTSSPSPAPHSPREASSPSPAPGGSDGGGGAGAPLSVPEAGGPAPLTLEAILELANEPDPGVRNASLIQAIGRLEFEAKMISKKRGDARKAALAADKSRDTAREIATQKEAAVPDLLTEAEDAERMAQGAEERAERLMVAAASARRVADERVQLATRAQEDAERAKSVYESALGMHERAYEVARMTRKSFEAAAAEIEKKKAKVFSLLGVTGGT